MRAAVGGSGVGVVSCAGGQEADLELGLDAPGSTVPRESGLGLEQCGVFLGDGVSVPTIFLA